MRGNKPRNTLNTRKPRSPSVKRNCRMIVSLYGLTFRLFRVFRGPHCPSSSRRGRRSRVMADHQNISTDDALDELRGRFVELAELASSLAHEIKNPLSVIRMNMDLLAEDFAKAETPKERRALSKIEMGGRDLKRS